jgi:hypothetical protein
MRAMDHRKAVVEGMTERYLLGELVDAEREAFEEHYFECAACAEDVKAAAAVVDGVREGSPERTGRTIRSASRPRFVALFWPLPLGAAAALALSLGVAVYQGAHVVPGLRREIQDAERLQLAPSYFLYASRAEPQVVTVPAAVPRVMVRLSTSFERPFARYRCQLRDTSGRIVQTAALLAPPTGEELQIQLPVRGLASGSYEIVLDGLDTQDGPVAAPELARYRFTLHHQEE